MLCFNYSVHYRVHLPIESEGIQGRPRSAQCAMECPFRFHTVCRTVHYCSDSTTGNVPRMRQP